MRPLLPERLVDRVAAARRVVVSTGAGMSAESGVPTFRDPNGLWERYRPEDLANEQAFRRDPVLVQRWYFHRRLQARSVRPHAGHEALAALAGLVPALTIITQNVDGLHQRAGSENVIELHGTLHAFRCIRCAAPADDAALDAWAGDEQHQHPRACDACGGWIRPGVVWFGEGLPQKAVERAHRATEEADVFLSVGTSGVVYPAAALPSLAKEAGAFVAEINPTPTRLAPALDVAIAASAGEVLPALVAALRERRAHRG